MKENLETLEEEVLEVDSVAVEGALEEEIVEDLAAEVLAEEVNHNQTTVTIESYEESDPLEAKVEVEELGGLIENLEVLLVADVDLGSKRK